MNTWNLDILYSSLNDPKLTEDFLTLEQHIQDNLILAKEPISKDNLEKELHKIIELVTCARKIGSFLSLNSSTDTTNPQIAALRNRYTTTISKNTIASTLFNQKVAACEEIDTWAQESPLIKDHLFYLNEIKQGASHLLSEKEEHVLSQMRQNASSTWNQLQSYLTSTVNVEMNGKNLTLSSVRNLAYDSSSQVRKEAYEAELKAYDKIKDAIAFSLNSIKGEARVVANLRGYPSVMSMTLEDSRMKQETLDAMMNAIKKSLPKFHQYLAHKAKLLGHENGLPWYDLFAPMASKEDSKTYTIEEAHDVLIHNFSSFSNEIAELIDKAFKEHWIDFEPRPGKVGGAFCSNLPFLKQSRVLTNYDGSFSDIVTLAHELGHAYHGHCIEHHSILNTSYTMPVAETASTFNETVIMNAAIESAETDAKKAALIESMLQDVTQVICDIHSRYEFEQEVVERRANEFLFADQLNEIMIKAQKNAYGSGLDPEVLHPYMWVCKSHYYSAGLNFYNFPYAFGCLFAKGLYALAEKQGTDFMPKYNALLSATTTASVEDVAMMADIDLTREDFWMESLNLIGRYIDQWIELTHADL
ncbi:MAG: M3 family oligoendopeptidase [Erysipelotrichaceae bacterium]|nr:M3 family oligoendopeptidase [Erysipelotrichaceae bacterium]